MVSSVSNTLYLITKGPDQFSSDLLPQDMTANKELTVILLQNGVLLDRVSAPRIYALGEDAAARNLSSPYQTISYREMLGMIFQAEHVVTL